MANLPVTVFLCIIFVGGLNSAPDNSKNDDRTILIDFEKYQDFHQPNVVASNKTNAKVCADSENKEYRKCGNKCVLSCRHTLYSEKFTVSDDECSKNACFEGCFCKVGYVRHYDKCVLAEECPVRNGRAQEQSSLQPVAFLRHFGMGCGLKGCSSGGSSSGVQPIHIYLDGDGSSSGSGSSGSGKDNNNNNNNNNNPINNIFAIPGAGGGGFPPFPPPFLPGGGGFPGGFPGGFSGGCCGSPCCGNNNGLIGGNTGGPFGGPNLRYNPDTNTYTLTFPSGQTYIFSRNGTLIRSFNNSNARITPPRIQLLQLDYGFDNVGDDFTDTSDYADRPPKQKDRSKSKPNVNHEHNDKSGTSDTPYSAYQYEFPYQYPYNFFQMAPVTSNSGTNSKNKTKKKSTSNTQNKQTKDPDKSVVPFISISVASHQAKSNADSENDSNASANVDNANNANSKSVYSPDQKPPPDQAAYFNYLNTYSPSHNQDAIQHAQSVDHRLNPVQYGFGVSSNAANSYGYGYIPFNGYNPMLMPFLNVATTPSPLERSGQIVKPHESSRSISQKTKNSRDSTSSKKNVRKP